MPHRRSRFDSASDAASIAAARAFLQTADRLTEWTPKRCRPARRGDAPRTACA
jgi:hypothetical protein